MYGCESCTVKKAEHRRIGAFELWFWRRLLTVPWTARISSQSILKISSGISLEGMMLSWNSNTLATSWEELTHGKDSDAGRDWGQEEKGMTVNEMAGWHHWLDGHESQWTLGVGDGQGGLVCCDSWGTRLSDWTELYAVYSKIRKFYWGEREQKSPFIKSSGITTYTIAYWSERLDSWPLMMIDVS